MEKDYHSQENIKMTLRIREIIKNLPKFAPEYFRGISETTSVNTRLVYSYDLKLFFNYLINECKDFKNINILDFDFPDLNKITPEHIEGFLEYLTVYKGEDQHGNIVIRKNKASGKGRKLAAVKTFFRYFYRKRKINFNPAELVDMPKLHEKAIVRLENHEVYKLLDEVENGTNLTKGQQSYHDNTKVRDLAIVTLLLGTGIRISECVGININHIDFNINGIKITRKGGDEVIIYFGDEVNESLKNYLIEREKKLTLPGHEDALFLSIQKKRLTDRSIQKLIKKYSVNVNSFKNISPHKLRSTYGTNLYRETGDIYLVADVLGHKDVNTTRKHYAQMDDARRREAVKFIKLRDDK